MRLEINGQKHQIHCINCGGYNDDAQKGFCLLTLTHFLQIHLNVTEITLHAINTVPLM